MTFFYRVFTICALMLVMSGPSSAADRSKNFYRNFELPTYHGLRLNYCSLQNKDCGMSVATRYCQMMGYAYADQQLIDHNVGLTHFLSVPARCNGWRCNGFKTIRCVARFTHEPPKPYHYRLRKFVYPRYEHYRVDWCYDGRRGCGRRAAFSFCRRMGYLRARHFAMQDKVAATMAIGNQKLCFGQHCKAFSYIDCFR